LSRAVSAARAKTAWNDKDDDKDVVEDDEDVVEDDEDVVEDDEDVVEDDEDVVEGSSGNRIGSSVILLIYSSSGQLAP
jgi:hypothetical protein